MTTQNEIPTIDDVVLEDIRHNALLRYYSERLTIKIMEIEKLRNEALEIQNRLIEEETKN